nr:putative peptidyl-tRNA hydrolase PTRHD1 [Pelodiscus sinensis]|eukprot:XP_006116808.1 putative peptidyl-tRNA hydrolase PTRHD1 [Pelodiscus sinensis]
MAAPGSGPAGRLVQYVVLRGDLQPAGSPSTEREPACNHEHSPALDEGALTTLAETLQQHNIDHKVWIEQPENITTCIALRPYPKEEVHQHLKKFKLLK